jgi:predicted nucleic acid-binding protein
VIVLDAGFVIAHLSPNDRHQATATEFLRSVSSGPLLMHSLNLAEVLVGGVRAGRGDEMLADLEAIGIAVAERSDGEPLRLARLRATHGLRLPDCCALDAALTTGSALPTFDDGLARAARRRHLSVEPESGASRR